MAKRICFGVSGLVALAALCWWLAGREFDPPYVSTEIFQLAFLTDEGFYTKAALIHARFGTFFQPNDFYVSAQTFLHTLALRGVFAVLGDDWQSARFLSVFASLGGLLAFWSICRIRLSRTLSTLASLSVLGTMPFLAYGRLATAEPLAIALSIAAVAIAARFSRTGAGACAALVLAALAMGAKLSYSPVLAAVALLVLADACLLWRDGHRAGALFRVASVVSVLAAVAVYVQLMRSIPNAHWDYLTALNLSGNLGIRVSVGTAIRWMVRSYLQNLPILGGGLVLLSAGLFFFFRRLYQEPRPSLRLFIEDRALIVFSLWTLLAAGQFGLTWMQAARYYLFALYPFSYFCFLFLSEASGRSAARSMGTLVLLLHVAAQANSCLFWRDEQRFRPWVDIGRDLARRVAGQGSGPVVVMGNGTADFVALFDRRIRPIDIGYASFETLLSRRQRIAYWRPAYLLVNEDDLTVNTGAVAALVAECHDFIRGVEYQTEYPQLFRNFYTTSSSNGPNLKLARILYRN